MGVVRLSLYVAVIILVRPGLSQDAAGVELILESSSGLNLPNITILSESNISLSGHSLICQGNNSELQNSQGNWIGPRGVTLPTGIGSVGNVFVLREPLPIRVKLYRSALLSANDEGIYTCTIPDSNGKLFTLYIGLYSALNYSKGTPSIPDQPTFQLHTTVLEQPPTFSLTCVSTNFPPTNVSWSVNGNQLTEGPQYHMTQELVSAESSVFNNTLLIKGAVLTGIFTCSVSNDRTPTPTSKSYNVTVPPTPPLNITRTFKGFGNVEISWDPPQGVPVDGYQLIYERVDSAPNSEGTVNVTVYNTSYLITSLTASATYSISLVAFSNLPTQPSDPINVTLEVSSSPANLSLTPISSSTVNVSWDAQPNVVEYIVTHFSVGLTCEGLGPSVENIVSPPSSSFILTGLEEDEVYSVNVRIVGQAAVGPPTDTLNVTTLIAAPSSPPLNVSIVASNPDNITVSWRPPPCLERNGDLTHYSVRYNDTTGGTSVTFTNSSDIMSTSFTVLPFRNYSVEVAGVVNGNLTGVYSVPQYTNLIGIPDSVTALSKVEDITSVTLAWKLPLNVDTSFSDSVQYIVSSNGTSSSSETVSSMSYEFSQLTPNTSYTFEVRAKSSFGMSNPMTLTGMTLLIPVVSIDVEMVNDTGAIVRWSRYTKSQDIQGYRVYYNTTDGRGAGNETLPVSESQFLLPNLLVEVQYRFELVVVVNTKAKELEGERSSAVTLTIPAKEVLSETARLALIGTAGSVVGLLIVIVITFVFLVILNYFTKPLQALKEEKVVEYAPLVSFSPVHTSSVPEGHPTVLRSQPDIHAVAGQEVVLRVESTGVPTPSYSWKYCGLDLSTNKAYVITDEGALIVPQVGPEHDGDYFFMATNKHGSVEQRVSLLVYSSDDVVKPPVQEECIKSVSIPLAEFGPYVSDLHANNHRNFKEQFKRLSTGQRGKSFVSATFNENRVRNRQQDILVYDDNRVMLRSLKRFLDLDHDYINASYVDGYKEADKFIATQGPLERTVVDFWRMVWQKRSLVIVMMTSLQEDLQIKSHRYWPNGVGLSEKHGPFRVTLEVEETKGDYVVRKMKLQDVVSVPNLVASHLPKRMLSPESLYSALNITHYQYTAWQEYGSPQHIDSLLAFHREIEAARNASGGSKAPIIVHCSGGAGRTGSFILLNVALEQAAKEKKVDIPSIVHKMRLQRAHMVKTPDQYMVVHDAVLEEALCGTTHFPVMKLSANIESLSQASNEEQNGFQSQFKVLDAVTPKTSETICSVAYQHKNKNRSPDLLPTDEWRVPLLSEVPDYINATYVPGYHSNKAYIITQGPMQNTRREFLKLILDRDVAAVVMLTDTPEEAKEGCSQYWSTEGNVEFGEFVVTQKRIWHHQNFVKRTLLLTNTKTGETMSVPHFLVSKWSTKGSDYDGGAIVNTMNLVTMLQRKSTNSAILVHCSDGIGRSAQFCAVMAALDQVRSEGRVDVFQVVKKLRGQLLGAISNWEQYRAIFKLVETYVSLFTTTANFQKH